MRPGPRVLARRPSATMVVRACDDAQAWDLVTEISRFERERVGGAAFMVIRKAEGLHQIRRND